MYSLCTSTYLFELIIALLTFGDKGILTGPSLRSKILWYICAKLPVGSEFCFSRWKKYFPICFQNFSGSYNFILLKNLLLYIWALMYLFVLGRERFFTVYICFKETLFFNFSHKLFNKYFSLPQSTCQFRVSVRK